MSNPAYSLICSVILASLLATGSALLLIRRGPTQRLRQLALTVALISLTQAGELLNGIWLSATGATEASSMYRLLVAALSLLAIYILGIEARDRHVSDRRLRLLEHAVPLPHKEGSGFRFLRAIGLNMYGAPRQRERVNAPRLIARGALVRLTARDGAAESISGQVTDCKEEPSGKTFMVSVRVGHNRDEVPSFESPSSEVSSSEEAR